MVKWTVKHKKTAGGFSLAVGDSLVHWAVLVRRRLSKKTFLRRKAIVRAFKVKSTVIILACKPESIHGVFFYLRYVLSGACSDFEKTVLI